MPEHILRLPFSEAVSTRLAFLSSRMHFTSLQNPLHINLVSSPVNLTLKWQPLLRPSRNHLKLELYCLLALTSFFKHKRNFLNRQSSGKSETYRTLLGIFVFECKTKVNNSINKNCQLLLAKWRGSARALLMNLPKMSSNSCRDLGHLGPSR